MDESHTAVSTSALPQSGDAERSAILVLAMHRSGSSAVTRIISLLGADLPSVLMPPTDANPRGYWESNELAYLHDQLLASGGSRWDDWEPFPRPDREGDLRQSVQDHIVRVLNRDFGNSSLFVIKDPRICRLVPIWLKLLEQISAQPRVVIPLRHPFEVANSLHVRDGIAFTKGCLLWLRHTIEAERTTRNIPRTFVNYEKLLADWPSEIGKVIDRLGVAWPRRMEEIHEEVSEFLTAGLRHHESTPDELDVRSDVVGWVRRVHHAIASLASAGENETVYRELDQVRAEFDNACQAFGDLIRCEREESAREALTTVTVVTSGVFNERMQDVQQQLAQQQGRLEAVVTGQQDVQARMDGATEQINGLSVTVSDHRTETEQLGGILTTCRAEVQELSTVVVAHGSRTDRLAEDLNACSTGIASLNSQIAAHARRAEDLGREVAQCVQTTNSSMDRLHQDMASVRAGIDQFGHLQDEVVARIDGLQAQIDAQRNRPLRERTKHASRKLRPVLKPIERVAKAGRDAAIGLLTFRWLRMSRHEMRLPFYRRRLLSTGLFDAPWYLEQNPDVAAAGVDPLDHWLKHGVLEGRNPNPYFDTSWYLQSYPHVAASGQNPLIHYLRRGAYEGSDPSPGFRSQRYLQEHEEVRARRQNPLAHFLQNRPDGDGVEEPSPQQPASPGRAEPVFEAEQHQQVSNPAVKLIAFYLPQFHPIPENDAWWGKGFTEWTNVTRARPLFDGHHQPQLPADLGFYDLRLPEVMERQVSLATQYGIQAFCFHYYWFGGKRLLEKPLDMFLDHPEWDLNFCLCWANENWTRRWDGQESDILIAQDHSAEDDLRCIADLARYIRDPRYLRVEGRPLVTVYRANLLSHPEATTDRWRQYCRETGIGEIFLAAARIFGVDDPRQYGFDAAFGFPPNSLTNCPPQSQVQGLTEGFEGIIYDYEELAQRNPTPATPFPYFETVSPAWDNTARRGKRAYILTNSHPQAYEQWLDRVITSTVARNAPEHRLVFLNAWNEWAEGAHLEPDTKWGYAHLNATARVLLRHSDQAEDSSALVESQTPHDDGVQWPRLAVFDGPAVETPATADSGKTRVDDGVVVFLGHDAARAGAQMVLLHILRWLDAKTSLDYRLILGSGGELLDEFSQGRDVLVLDELVRAGADDQAVRDAIGRHCGAPVRLVYANTVASDRWIEYFDTLDAPVLTHVHELEDSIRRYSIDSLRVVKEHSSHYIAASPAVAENLTAKHGIAAERIDSINAFIDRQLDDVLTDKATRRRELGLPADKTLVFGCGTVEPRKATDLFVQVAAQLRDRGLDDFHFCWIGGACDPVEPENVARLIREHKLESYVTLVGPKQDPRRWFAAGDVFLLPSREDPFPLVCLEAAEAGMPVVCFADAGGMPDFVADDAGVVVPYLDVDAMSRATADLLLDDQLRQRLGRQARNKLLTRHTTDQAMPAILNTVRQKARLAPHVSVIVPCYNHARFLQQRLDSVFNQTYQDFEVLILDDSSSDDTLAVLEPYAQHPNVQLVTNDENSGSTFRQWIKGIERAKGELIWIAEDDDFSETTFLERLVGRFADPAVHLAYCQSVPVDVHGRRTGSYLDYTDELSPTKWRADYTATCEQELNDGLAVKNTIPNASAVVFRKPDVNRLRAAIEQYQFLGDWCFYVSVAFGGQVSFVAEELNYHRRHDDTCSARFDHVAKRFEELRRLHQWIASACRLTDETRGMMRMHAERIWRACYPSQPASDFSKDYSLQVSGEPRPEPLIVRSRNRQRMILGAYSADRTGAPLIALRLAESFARESGQRAIVLLTEDGALRPDFERVADVFDFDGHQCKQPEQQVQLNAALQRRDELFGVCNGMDTNQTMAFLNAQDLPFISLIHEFSDYYPTALVSRVAEQSGHVVFPADRVQRSMRERLGVLPDHTSVIPQGLLFERFLSIDRMQMRRRVLHELGLPDDTFLVLGCGFLHARKGCEWFVPTAKMLREQRPDVNAAFVWLGKYDGAPEDVHCLRYWLESDVKRSGLTGRVFFLGERGDTAPYFGAADCFVMLSRLDPFPCVVLEAMACEVPVLCFSEGTGSVDALSHCPESIVPYADLGAVTNRICELHDNADLRASTGRQNRDRIETEYSFQRYAESILELAQHCCTQNRRVA